MGEQARGAGEQPDNHVEGRRRMPEHLNREERAANRTNDRVHGVPRRINPWNFVGKKFEEIENPGDGNDDGIAEDLERLVSRRKDDPMLINGETDDEDGQVKIDAGETGQAERDAEEIESLHGKIMR